MNNKITIILLILVSLVFSACQSGMSASSDYDIESGVLLDSEVGSVGNNPKLPSKLMQFFPVFQDYIFEAEYNFAFDSVLNLQQNKDKENPEMMQKNIVLVFLGLESINKEFDLLSAYGDAITDGLANSKVQDVTSDLQSVSITKEEDFSKIPEVFRLLGSVEFKIDDQSSDYVRYYLKDTKKDKYHGTYVVQTDEEGTPVKGLFAYINPLAFGADDKKNQERRFSSFAYDFTDPEHYLMVVREESYNAHLEDFMVTQVLYDCRAQDLTCVAEYLDVVSEAPVRELTNSVRFSWSADTEGACVANVFYTEESVAVSDAWTQIDGDVSSCNLPDPIWNDHVFNADDLLLRYNDTFPMGGSAIEYFEDGSSVESWNQLNATTIDEWLQDYLY